MTRCLQALPRGLAWLAALAVLLSGCAAPPGAATPPTAEADAAAGTTAAKPPNRRAAASNAAQEGAQPYLFALDPLRPSVIVENDDAAAQRDLWVRVRAGFAMPDIDNALVLKWQEWYATRPDYVQRMSERSSRYLFHVVEEIDKRGMPTELALLPYVPE